MYMASTVGTIS